MDGRAVSTLWEEGGFERVGVSEWNQTKEGFRGRGHTASTLALPWAARGRLLASPVGRLPTSEDGEGVKAGDLQTTLVAAALKR